MVILIIVLRAGACSYRIFYTYKYANMYIQMSFLACLFEGNKYSCKVLSVCDTGFDLREIMSFVLWVLAESTCEKNRH